MVRKARLDDAAAIAAVHMRTWQVAYRGLVPDEILDRFELDEWTTRRRQMLEDESVFVFVAETDGDVAGFVAVGPCRDRDLEGEGELYGIYVRPEQWRHGLGRELISAGEDALRELGFAEAGLWVLEDNPRARRFYEANGWLLDEPAHKAYPAGDKELSEVRYRRRL